MAKKLAKFENVEDGEWFEQVLSIWNIENDFIKSLELL